MRRWVRARGGAGCVGYCVAAALRDALPTLDSRALVVLRETLAFYSPLADFAFAMQGLGSGAITLAGSPAQQAAYLPAVARGDKIAAFALSEPDAGSDAGAMKTVATQVHATGARGQNDAQTTGFVLDGSKTWISNGGIADYYCVFAKTAPEAGTPGICPLPVSSTTPGLALPSIHL